MSLSARGSGRGKRGGLRVISYWQTADDQVWLLLAYPKSEREDLSQLLRIAAMHPEVLLEVA